MRERERERKKKRERERNKSDAENDIDELTRSNIMLVALSFAFEVTIVTSLDAPISPQGQLTLSSIQVSPFRTS